MREYLLYGQIQQRLTAHMEELGRPASFFDTVAELWREKAYWTAPALPTVSFAEWDGIDMDIFRTLVNQTPVALDEFYKDLHADHSTQQASRQIPELDVHPMKIAENQAMGAHEHESFEMLYVLQGQAQLLLGTSSRGCSEGELCLVAPGFPHDVVVDAHSVVISITFAEVTIENTLYRLLKSENAMTDFFRASLSQGSRGYMLFHMEPAAQVRFLIRNIFHEGYSQQEYASQICVNFIEILFSYLLRNCAQDWERYSEAQPHQGFALLPIMQYIQTHYRTTSLQEVARHFHYEPSYLGKLIRAHMGKNYTKIVSELRIEDAKALLRGTNDSIEKVAEQAGFQSAVHFSRSFRQYTGMTPRQYRKQSRGGSSSRHDRKC